LKAITVHGILFIALNEPRVRPSYQHSSIVLVALWLSTTHAAKVCQEMDCRARPWPQPHQNTVRVSELLQIDFSAMKPESGSCCSLYEKTC